MRAALLLLASALAAAPAPPRTLRVGAGGPYPTPAAALAVARAGDTVLIAPGRHPGGITVPAGVVLAGEPGAVLDGGGTGTVVRLAGDSAELRGLAIRNGGRDLQADDAGVQVVRARGCRLADLDIAQVLHGVYLLESSGTTLERLRIRGDERIAEARRGNGIHLFHADGNRIERTDIAATRDGIYFSFASGNRVRDNVVTGVRYGLHYMYSNDNRFRGNRFERNAAGAAIMFSQRIELRGNVFAEHRGDRAYGLLLQTAQDVVAEDNVLRDNRAGLYLDNTTGSMFRGNVITGNGIGVDLLTSAEGNTFTGNLLRDNHLAVRTATGAGENRWAERGRGNAWGAPQLDLDGDGVGDAAYRPDGAFATLAASRPVLAIFAGTPAARALDWAEDAFPVFDVPRITDPAPLAHDAGSRSAPGPRQANLTILAAALALGGAATIRRMRRNPGARA